MKSKGMRLLRGGSWSGIQDFARCASRLGDDPDSRNYYVGFRLAQDYEAKPEANTWRVMRGGSWYYDQHGARCTYRDWNDPLNRDNNVGFRLVQDRSNHDN